MKPGNEKQTSAEQLTSVSELLDRSVDELDQHTVAALRRARAQAVEAASSKPLWQGWLWPAGGLATALAAGLTAIMISTGPANLTGELDASEFELLASQDTLEVVEDLEFYQWLSEAMIDEAGGTG